MGYIGVQRGFSSARTARMRCWPAKTCRKLWKRAQRRPIPRTHRGMWLDLDWHHPSHHFVLTFATCTTPSALPSSHHADQTETKIKPPTLNRRDRRVYLPINPGRVYVRRYAPFSANLFDEPWAHGTPEVRKLKTVHHALTLGDCANRGDALGH